MTYAELQEYVAERLTLSAADSAKVTQLKALLAEEHIRIVGDFRLLTSHGTISVTADDPTLTLPADWLETLKISLGTTVLETTTPEQFAAYEASAASVIDDVSGPAVYYQSGESEIRVYPTPADAGSATIHYVTTPTAMSAASDTPEGIPKGHHQYLGECVVERMALAEEANQLAAAARRLKGELEEGLRRHVNRRSGRGRRRLRLAGYGPR